MSYEEQSKDKYPSIFSPQMEAIVFIIFQIFFATRAVLKIVSRNTIVSRDKFKPIRIGENLVVNYNA